MTIRIFVVDDHTLFRRGLIALLRCEADFEVVGDAGDASEALRRAVELQPQLILLDNHLPGVRGVDALPGLKEAVPQAKILMLTVSEDEADLAAALRAGAAGYLLKTIEGDDLAKAIRCAATGESVVSPELTTKLVNAFRTSTGTAASPVPAPSAEPVLSPREQDILRELARGVSNKEIARTLSIAETTVKIHVQHILRKLNLTSRVQAAVYATERGWG